MKISCTKPELNGHYVALWYDSDTRHWEPAANRSEDAIIDPAIGTVRDMVQHLQGEWDAFGNVDLCIAYFEPGAVTDNGHYDRDAVRRVADVLQRNDEPDENDETHYNKPIFCTIQQ